MINLRGENSKYGDNHLVSIMKWIRKNKGIEESTQKTKSLTNKTINKQQIVSPQMNIREKS